MPIPTAITAISGSYPNIAVNPDKCFFVEKLFILISIFSLTHKMLANYRKK